MEQQVMPKGGLKLFMTSSQRFNVNITADYSSIYAKHEATDKMITTLLPG